MTIRHYHEWHKSQTHSAICIGIHESGSQAWHDLRNAPGVIGGSEAGVILGLSAFESPYTLWAKKRGLIPSGDTSPAMEWGSRLEAVILERFAEGRSGQVYDKIGTWENKARPWQRANPDGLLFEDGAWALVEIKTARDEAYWKDEDGQLQVPPSYVAQVQWYLSCLGLDKAYVAVLFGGSRYHEFEITGNLFEQELAIAKCEEFLPYLNGEAEPEYSAPYNITADALRYRHSEIEDEAVELGALGSELLAAQKELTATTERADKLKAEVLGAMGNARRGLVDNQWLFTRQARKGGLPYLVLRK